MFEAPGPRVAAAPSSTYGTPLHLEGGTVAEPSTLRSRFHSTYDKEMLHLSALAVFALCCAAPTYSLLIQSLALSIFEPDTAPWVALNISALILPAMLGGVLLAILLFGPILLLTLWVGGLEWNVPYGLVLANIPILVGTAILPHAALRQGSTIVHAMQLVLWGLVPPMMIVGALGCVGLLGAGLIACGAEC